MEKRELSPETRRHLDKSVHAIAEEFDEVASPKRVRDVADEQLEELLPEARLQEFIPALVSSKTREELLDESNKQEAHRPKQGDEVASGRTGVAWSEGSRRR